MLNFKGKNLVFALLLSFPFVASADNSVTDSTKDAMQSTGKAIQNAASTTGQAVSDTAITTAVKAKLLAEADVPSTQISVTTKNGVVALKGKVDTQLQANKVVQVAQSVHGVKDVDDSKLSVSSSKDYLRDSFITAKALGKIAQLSDDKLIASNHDLHVETTDGVVHVYGTVGKSGDEGVIKDAVRSISGVKDVNTNISTAS